MRPTLGLLLCVSFLVPPTARAGGTLKDAMAVIPADSFACVCIPSLKKLDASYQNAIKALGLQSMVPEPAASLLTLLRSNFPFTEGVDENGMLALVVMPAQTPFELPVKMAFMVSAKEPKALLETLGATPGEEGVFSVNLFGQPSYAMVSGSRVVISRMPDVAKKIVNSKEGLSSRLAGAEMEALGGLDIVVWLGTDHVLQMLQPQIQGLLGMMTMTQSSVGPLQAKQAELSKKQIEMLVDGLGSFALGAAFSTSGLDLRFALTGKAGSELRKRMQVRNTTKSLLRHLPGKKYVVAFGETVDPAQAKSGLSDLNDYISLAKEIEGIDKAQVDQAKALLEEWVPMMTGLRGSLQLATPGEFGVFAGALIVETPDSAKWLEQAEAAFKLVKSSILGESMADLIGTDAKTVAKAFSFQTEAEKIADAKVTHLKLDLSQIEDLDEEDVEEMQHVIGKEGPLLRLAAANPQTVLVGFGGGPGYFQRALELVKKDESPLDADAGIRNTSAELAKDRYVVMYVAVDKLLTGIRSVMTALEEEPFPIQMPALPSPLAAVGTGGDGWARMDLFVPTPLLVATKDAVMTMMGQGAVATPPKTEDAAKKPQPAPGK